MSGPDIPANRQDLPAACRDEGWETTRLLVPREEIGYVAYMLEGYDNHFLVRTEVKGFGVLRAWYPQEHRALLDAVLLELSGELPVEVLGREPGMTGLDEVYPE